MEEGKDQINDYEKIFGEFRKPINLFDDEEYYTILRKQITSLLPGPYKKGKLPFQDIKLIPYADFMRSCVINNLIKKGYHIFYLKRSNHGSNSFCDAAGYYHIKSKKFRIIEYSYVAVNNNFDIFDFELQQMRQKAIMARSKVDGKKRYLTESIFCNDPSIAASYVLGFKADYNEWKDGKGQKLISLYPSILEPDFKEQGANNSVSLDTTEKKKEQTVITNKATFPLKGEGASVEKQTPQVKPIKSKHLFYLSVSGLCKAAGYLDSQTNNFYIQKDSLVALYSDMAYSMTKSGDARVRFLEKTCIREGNFYRVIKDAKCRSASAAACYVLGRSTSYVHWIDANGKSLKDCYPSKFFQDNPELYADVSQRTSAAKEIDTGKHSFFINWKDIPSRTYSASGYYVPISNQFLLKKGSILSQEVSKMFQYTAMEFQRRKFIAAHCQKDNTGYKVKHDILIDNPDLAASFVMGSSADGMTVWRDINGKTIKEIFNIVQ